MIWTVVLLVILLALSALFSSIETAITSVSLIRAKQLARSKGAQGRTLLKLKRGPHRMLITILIGNNFVNIAASMVMAALAMQLFRSNALGIATGVMTFLILIFGEITPKSYAALNSERLALRFSRLVDLLAELLKPVIWLLDVYMKVLFKGDIHFEKKISEEDIKSIASIGEEEGAIKKDEKEMIQRIFLFDDTKVSDIMTPRVEMFAIEQNRTVGEVLNDVIEMGYSRIPVYARAVDKVCGIVYVKDILAQVSARKTGIRMKEIMVKPLFVYENKKLDAMLKDFKKKRLHIAIVVDEYGGVRGMVTIEDLLEELVGEIYDETDSEHHMIQPKGKEYIIDAHIPLEILNERLRTGISERKAYDTLSGYILERLGRFPRQGERMNLKGFELVVDSVEGQVIRTVRLVQKGSKNPPKTS
ncbi:HlyC/CorC family transporter [Candidatus Woesearchaeota archaeon]|nr:HlyC/CorC family transporter [Candidatus Woesearchaeota archaeon]